MCTKGINNLNADDTKYCISVGTFLFTGKDLWGGGVFQSSTSRAGNSEEEIF